MSQPVFTVIAGSNGCGKSTLSSYARSEVQAIPLLDPDAVARSLQGTMESTASNIEAGKQILRLAEDLLAHSESFTVETTLSGSSYLRMAERAKANGYAVLGIFIGTEDVAINMERVRARVLKGGHDIAESDQRRRFPRTLANMERLMPLLDLAILFDNSTEQGHRVIAVGPPARLRWLEPVPNWAQRFRLASF